MPPKNKKKKGAPAQSGSGKSKSNPTTAASTGNSTAASSPSGFAFADPQFSPDDYANFTTAQKMADSNLPTVKDPALEPIPPLRVDPPVMDLSDVLPSARLQAYDDYITFHAAGDTGGIKTPAHQFLVADKMTDDFTLPANSTDEDRPAFFYHLGDVVYYYGLDEYYYEQFYDPYRNYPAPIFAIPGNHDAALPPNPTNTSLEAFCQHFCTAEPMQLTESQGASRTTMTQPGVYFTLNCPFVKIIGLYSNTQEGPGAGVIADNGVVGQAQKEFLIAQLQQAKNFNGAVILAVHHPPFTMSSDHNPSPDMLSDIDDACNTAGFMPDCILSGHSHLYERYTRYIEGRQVPFVVSGCGGYPNLTGLKNKNGPTLRPPLEGKDRDGNRVVMENYFDQTFGYLRLSVSKSILSCEFVGVSDPPTPGKTLDRFTLDLTNHSLTAFQLP
jgi:Calcineurin-like phosphoesterase